MNCSKSSHTMKAKEIYTQNANGIADMPNTSLPVTLKVRYGLVIEKLKWLYARYHTFPRTRTIRPEPSTRTPHH